MKLIVLALVLFGALGWMGWVVLGNFLQVDRQQVPKQWSEEFSRQNQLRYPSVPQFRGDHPLFTSPQYTGLRTFVTLPVLAGATGKENPFAPPAFAGATTTPAE
ncbi:MAG: hypothetical protein PHI63_00695 [Patescibacteria group bacterium]|nr:hypothetical protein [Patescibacteria group bacterium]